MPNENVEIEAIIIEDEEPGRYLLTVDTPMFSQTEEKIEGEVITVTAISSDEYVFSNWSATGLALTESQKTSETITFTMPGNAVGLEGVYEYEEYMLLNYYNAEHNSGINVYDSSATTFVDLMGNNNGTVNGAIVFDGIDDYVALDERNLEYPTVETIFEISEVGKTQIPVSNINLGGYGFYIVANNTIRFGAYVNGTYQEATYNEALRVGTKYHAVGSFDGNTIKIYINGVQVNETTVSGTIGEPNINSTTNKETVLMMGANPHGDEAEADYLNGKIYLTKVYDGALTDEQVYQQYLFTQEY